MTENLPDTNVGNNYIRIQDLIDALSRLMTGQTMSGYTWMYTTDVYDAIASLPFADVDPVVRCKDCGWAMKSTELPGWYMCKCEEAFDYYAKPDDFCSHGERRE